MIVRGWSPGDRLFLMSLDHRGSVEKALFGACAGQESDSDQRARISDLKALIYEGLEQALAHGAPRAAAGVLVDEQCGAGVARRAKAAGLALVMPAERSGQDEFDLEYGAGFADHIEKFDPDLVKVLLRDNPEGNPELNARQAARLGDLSHWLREHRRALLLELRIPPTPAQPARTGGDAFAYQHRVLPDLVPTAIGALHQAGVEPDVWNVQRPDSRAGGQRTIAQAQAGGRDNVVCIVAGHRTDDTRGRRRLEEPAAVDGYVGFTVGRAVWFDALTDHLAGRCDRGAARTRIARKYQQMVDVYEFSELYGSRHQLADAPAGGRVRACA